MENNNGHEGKTALANTNTAVAKPQPTLQSLLSQENVRKRFEEMLGKKAAGFISSIISATKSNQSLQSCEPNSIIGSAVIAATLDLPIQNNLGFAAIIPYGGMAQFQMMYRGYIQLAMRTGQYLTLNVCEVFDGELISENRFTGEYKFDSSKKKSDKIIGYTAYFKMINGFEKTVYWTVEQVTAHGKKYSKAFNKSDGRWKLDFDSMAKKTVIKLLLSKYGILSVDMQTAQIADQAIVNDADTLDVTYIDNSEPKIDKEAERINLLLADCVTVGQVRDLAKSNPGIDAKLFQDRENELVAEAKVEPEKVSEDIFFAITTCETTAQVNLIFNTHTALQNNKEFKDAINKRKIEIGKSLEKKTA